LLHSAAQLVGTSIVVVVIGGLPASSSRRAPIQILDEPRGKFGRLRSLTWNVAIMEYDQLQKYVVACLSLMRSMEALQAHRDLDDVLREALVPGDDRAEVAAYPYREKLIVGPSPRLVTLTPWGRTWEPPKQ
jgi:hypothetical protein